MTRQEILQVAKPILFNTDMVRAILDGRKTVTRRVIKCRYDNTAIRQVPGVLKELIAHPNDVMFILETEG